MDRATILALWNDSWETGHGYAPWKDALNELTPSQAAWKPGPNRHSVWAHVNHVSFWREYLLAAVRGEPKPSQAEIASQQFDAPADPAHATPQAWSAAKERLSRTQTDVAASLADPRTDPDHFGGLVAHDAYHLGQIMLLRALQGMKPLL